ncbi:MAG: hypothetical protein DRR16_33740, partial [Candidatus Parabeggiatoa sp. nov. 3]
TLRFNGAGNKNTFNGAGNKNTFNGGQQKHVTHPTLIYWWATKTRYPPYNSLKSFKKVNGL